MKTTLFDTSALANTEGLTPEKKAERLQVLALVQQFEGMLLTEMLRDVKAEDDPDADSFGLGGSTMTDLMQGEFGQALSRGGGLGLRQLLAESLLKREASVDALDPVAMASRLASTAGRAGVGTVVPAGRAPEVDGREGMVAAAAILGAIESEGAGRPVTRDELLAGSLTAAQDDIDRAIGLA